MAVILVVLAVLVVSYASSMKAYLEQRNEINDLRGQIVQSTKDIGALEREKKRWGDKAYVATLARERFGWVLPGEIAYQVIDRDGKVEPGSVTVQETTHDAFREAAVRAAERFRFRPAKLHGQPVAVSISIPIDWQIQN